MLLLAIENTRLYLKKSSFQIKAQVEFQLYSNLIFTKLRADSD